MKTSQLCAGVVAGALWLAAGTAAAQTDTLRKIKDSGAITMGVRDASGARNCTHTPVKTAENYCHADDQWALTTNLNIPEIFQKYSSFFKNKYL